MRRKVYRVVLLTFLILAGCSEQTVVPAAKAADTGKTAVALNLQVIEAEETARAAQKTAGAYRAIQTATESARREAATQVAREQTRAAGVVTRQAQQTATERAWMIQGWTATADSARATATFESQATASAVSARMEAAQHTATVQAMNVLERREQLDLERQEMMNQLWAVTPWAILVLAVFICAVAALSLLRGWSRYRIVPHDVNGDAPLLIVDGLVIDADRSARAVTDPRHPELLPVEQQLQLVAGDQRVNAVRALPRVVSRDGQTTQTTAPQYSILAPQDAPPKHLLPDPDVLQVLDGDWSET